MKLVRSDSLEVVHSIASANVRAIRYLPAFVYGCSLNVLIVLLALVVSLTISPQAAAWFGVPIFLVWNVYVLWLTKSYRRNWAIAVCADRIYIRLSVNNLEVLVLEASEITSMSIKAVEVFLYGPKPRIAEWLVIEPAQAVAESLPSQMFSFLEDIWTHDSGNLVRVSILEGRLTIGWKWCQPVLRVFLQQVAQECPSIGIAPEQRSELDLNGIWHGISLNLDAQKRQLLVQAKRLGFGSECAQRLSQYKHKSLREAAAYLAKIEQEEAGTEQPIVQACGPCHRGK